MLDLKICGGLVIDGTGAAAFKADVGVVGDKIVAIGDLTSEEAAKTIDATGKLVTPGFIEMHSHADYSLVVSPDASARIHEGVTTEVIGNCGIGVAPVSEEHREELVKYLGSRLVGSIPVEINLPWKSMDDYLTYLEEHSTTTNVVPLVAQGAIRIHEMGFAKGRATKEQMAKMKVVLKEAMDAGCVGMSSGLIYMPGEYSSQDELAELAEVLADYDSYYVTHMRNEGNKIWDAIDEAVAIAKHAGIRLHISHLKLMGTKNRGKTEELFTRLENAGKELKGLVYDAYPYNAGCTSLGAMFPPWLFEGGLEKLLERLTHPEIREKVILDLQDGAFKEVLDSHGGWAGIVIATCAHKESEYALGQSVESLAKAAGKDPYNWAFDFFSQEGGRVQIVAPIVEMDDMKKIVSRPETMIGSDSMSLAETGVLGTGRPHPRAFATRATILEQFVREEKLFSFETAINKLTKLAADHLRLDRRGQIKEGFYADLVVVDFKNVKANATYADPLHYSTGFDAVVVNGKVALENGVETKNYSGRVLRHGK
ncbi:MAG: D-aminoacylase [Phascolarctobacterium sp.]|nr:D-aminoacylase [Phascolarctobacterium sp.]